MEERELHADDWHDRELCKSKTNCYNKEKLLFLKKALEKEFQN